MIRMIAGILPILMLLGMFIIGALILAVVRRLSGWNSVYERLAKRYGGNSYSGYFFTKPSMAFNYGRTYCRVQNRKTLGFRNGKKTEIILGWPDNSIKLELTTAQRKPNSWNPLRLRQIEIEDAAFQNIYVFTNMPQPIRKLLSDQVQWQIEQLRRHTGQEELQVTINRGKMVISKPGYIKNATQLDDFVRFGLELYDLMKLTDAIGISFVNDQSPNLVEDVKCPVCNEAIQTQIVTCVRCRTPHCFDCWQYNGQCATFACYETRYVRSNGQIVTP